MQPIDPEQSSPAPVADSTARASWLAPAPIAPAWHTAVLLLGIVLLSFAGAKELAGPHAHVNRLHTYAMTLLTEFIMLAWVYLGLRLQRVPFSSIFGDRTPSSRSIGLDFASAGVFWIGSLFLLGTINVIWMATDAALHHRSLFPNGKPDPSQQKLFDTLTRLAPNHGWEFAAWILVCVTAGLTEEIVFRGYFQRQFTAWARGTVTVGVVLSAILFGCGHGYQGARQMVLLSIFGALFSLLSIYRRNIRAGIIAHAWQDIFAGVMISVVRAVHPF